MLHVAIKCEEEHISCLLPRPPSPHSPSDRAPVTTSPYSTLGPRVPVLPGTHQPLSGFPPVSPAPVGVAPGTHQPLSGRSPALVRFGPRYPPGSPCAAGKLDVPVQGLSTTIASSKAVHQQRETGEALPRPSAICFSSPCLRYRPRYCSHGCLRQLQHFRNC